MARVPLSEFKAKSLLSDTYLGWAAASADIKQVAAKLNPKIHYVLKVDQGIKKRAKQGLIAIKVLKKDIPAELKKLERKGFSNFLIEPYIEHVAAQERYLSLERVREGIRILYSTAGGIDIETAGAVGQAVYVGKRAVLDKVASSLGLKTAWLKQLIERMNQLHITFVEINPLLVRSGKAVMLDCAVTVDSAAAFFVDGQWSEANFVSDRSQTPEENVVKQLNENSASSLSLRVLNPNGGVGMLLSGGGASIALADGLADGGASKQIINYGEYSGNPSLEETYLYTKQVVSLLLKSKAKKKTLVIAGGVANFTDIKATFKGVIQALAEQAAKLKRQKIKVFVRRGGPNEAAGLASMSEFLKSHGLYGGVSGSAELLTKPIRQALEYLGK